jgi:hypothetical protein
MSKREFTTGTVFAGEAPVLSISVHIPCRTIRIDGIMRIVSKKRVAKALPAEAWINLAKAPKNLCFCQVDPS